MPKNKGVNKMSNEIREITADEDALMRHVSRWGSDGYPVHKLSAGRWVWGDFLSVKGAPTIYRTKREATAAFNRFYDILLEAHGQHAKAKWEAEHA